MPDAQSQALAALVKRRHQVVAMLTAEQHRFQQALPAVRPNLAARMAWLEQALKPLDGELDQLPPFASTALADGSQLYLTPRLQWADATGGGSGSVCQSNWQMLLPVGGSLVMGVINNPSNGLVTVTAQWLWAYLDGLLNNRAGVADGPAWTYSIEASLAPNPAHGGGWTWDPDDGAINVNLAADPYLTLDPTLQVAGSGSGAGAGGVNQIAAYAANGSGAVLPFDAEVIYSPLYLSPR